MATRPFGLRDDPFVEGHDRRLVHPHRRHRAAVERITRALEQHAALVLVSGPDGVGKTTAVLEALDAAPKHERTELTATAELDAATWRARLLAAFGVASDTPDHATLAATLAARGASATPHVLVIDAAELLSGPALEALGAIAALDPGARGALSVVLMASPALEFRLAEPEHAALRAHLALSCPIEPLTARESEALIHHRMQVAGGSGTSIPRASCRAIHALANGIPRAIQTIAAAAIEQAHADGALGVGPAHVAAVAKRLDLPMPAPAANEASAAPEPAPPPAAEAIAEPAPETGAAPAPPPAPAPESIAAPAPPPAHAPEPEPAPEIVPAPAPRPAAKLEPKSSEPPAASEFAPGVRDVTEPIPTPQLGAAAVDDWLARFRDPEGPPRIGSRVSTVEPLLDMLDAPLPESAPDEADTTAESGTAPKPRPRPKARRGPRPPGRVVGRGRTRPSRWARRRDSDRWVGVAVAIVIAGGALLFGSRFLGPRHPRKATMAATTTAAPAAPAAPEAGAPSVEARSASERSRVSATPLAPGLRASAAKSAPGTHAAAAAATTDSLAAARYAIQVGTFLVAERADTERDRVAGLTPLECRIVHGHEDGADVFRIVIGPLTSRREAERVGDELFSEGAVTEARVIRWSGDAAHPR